MKLPKRYTPKRKKGESLTNWMKRVMIALAGQGYLSDANFLADSIRRIEAMNKEKRT